MANYTVTTSVAEEKAVTYHVAKYNAKPENPGVPITNVQYIRARTDHVLGNLVEAMREERRAALEQKYQDATPAQQASVNSTLGYTE